MRGRRGHLVAAHDRRALPGRLDHQVHVGGVEGLEILVVPVPGPFTLLGGDDGEKKINPWFYDASSTNRHNKTGFDLWAEILVGGKTNVIANWKN